MSVDDRLREGLPRAASSITPLVEDDLRAVRRGARRRAVRSRVVIAFAGVLASVVLALSAPHLRDWWYTQPAEPGPSESATVPNPFAVVRTFTPADLGLRRVLQFAIGPDGNLYVIDTGQRVSVITPEGDVLRQWGTHGPGQGEFRLGKAKGAIAVGVDGQVYVSDSGNDRVQVFTADGTFERQFGSSGSDPGSFEQPFDIAVDDGGNVYVADDARATVSAFGPDGSFLWQTGQAIHASDLIGHEHFAYVDSLGRLVSANDDAGRVIYLSASGEEVDAFGSASGEIPATSPFQTGGALPGGACDATVDAADDVVVNSCDPPNTEVFDASHRLIGAWYGSPFKLAPRFGPNGEVFALGHDGSILELTMSLPTG